MIVMAKKSLRKQFKTELEPSLVSDVTALFDHRGIPKTEGITRVLRWFLQSNDVVQSYVLGQLPESLRVEAANKIAAEIRGERRAGGTDEEHDALLRQTDADVAARRDAQSSQSKTGSTRRKRA